MCIRDRFKITWPVYLYKAKDSNLDRNLSDELSCLFVGIFGHVATAVEGAGKYSGMATAVQCRAIGTSARWGNFPVLVVANGIVFAHFIQAGDACR